MVACKIILICLAVVAMNARLSQSHFLKEVRDCACFPTDKGRVRISNLADKHGKHERTVVYIFKHQDTRKVTIYVPSEEKQVKFPDLTVNSHETYVDYTIENLYQIVNNPKVPLPSHSVQTHVIDLQIPDVPVHHNLINHKHPQIINIKQEIKPHKNGKKTVSTDVIDVEVDFQVNGNKGINDVNRLPQVHKHTHEPVIHVIEPVNIAPGHKETNFIKVPLVTVHPNHHNILNTLVDVPDNIHIEMDQKQNVHEIDTINMINGQDTKKPSIINIKKITDEVNQNISPIVITKPSKGSVTIIDNVIQETDINSITKIQEMLNGNNDNVVPSAVSLKQVNNPVFEKWLIEEISNVGSATYNALEIHKIKIRLLLVLEQNGLHFSETGDLIDMNGYVLKISNLKLQRVMISDPVVYKKLGGKCVPHGIPYLEAVFVSLVNPPTVLGVIPLRTTSLPRCKGGKCKKCSAKKNNHLLVSPRLPQKLNLAPIHGTKMGLISRMSSEDKSEDVLPTRVHTDVDKNGAVLPTHVHTAVNKNEDVPPILLYTEVDKNEAVLPTRVQNVVDKNEAVIPYRVQSVLDNNEPSAVHTKVDKNENVVPTRVRTGIHDGHDRQDNDKSLHDHDNDDGLGIRIIGGRPATSSGTPVSSRGRSGIKEVSYSVY